jgi:hypothetical protein
VNSLEPEYLELNAAGLIDDTTTSRAVALDDGTIFSVFEELRFVLYAAVAAITAGVGILVKKNLEHIGPLSLIIALALVAAACYGTAIRTRLRGEPRTLGGDYLLLLGALIMSADLGYIEAQFHWLGSYWAWHLLILAALHAATAYALDSRLVLSVSLASLAAWFGIEQQLGNLFLPEGSLRYVGFRTLACASVILLWGTAHRRLGAVAEFEDVFEHFAANLGFWGTLALCFTPETRFIGLALLIALAGVSIVKGWLSNQEAFVIYGVAYTALGLCVVEAQVVHEELPGAVLALMTVMTAIILLWQFHQRMKRAAL